MAESLKTVLVSNGKSRLFERGQLDAEESTTFLAWEMPLGFVFGLSFVGSLLQITTFQTQVKRFNVRRIFHVRCRSAIREPDGRVPVFSKAPHPRLLFFSCPCRSAFIPTSRI